MLLHLNEYCFYAICDYLNLTDHFALSRVCKELHQLIENKFRRNCNPAALRTSCWNKETQELKIPAFVLKLLENTDDAIECDTDELYELKGSLENLEFETVTTLKLTVEKIQVEQAVDIEDLITNLFPCLFKLILPKNFTRIRFFYLSTIEEVEVRCTPEDGIWDLIQICDLNKITFEKPLKEKTDFKRLIRCPKLEELTMSSAMYSDLVPNIGFRHIMQLTELTLTDAVNNIDELRLDENDFYRLIDSIIFHLPSNHNTRSTSITINANMSRLRRLTFINDDGRLLKAFCQLNSKKWNTLEEIYYLQSTELTNPQQQQKYLLYMTCLCPRLRVLDISGSAFDDRLVKSLSSFLNLQSRSHKLLLRCYNTNITRKLKVSPQIILSYEKFYHFLPEENEIQIELKDERRTAELMQYLKDLMVTFKESNSELDECLEILSVVEEDFQGIEQSLLAFEYNTSDADSTAPLTAAQLITREKLQLVRSELRRSTQTILEKFWIDHNDETLDHVLSFS